MRPSEARAHSPIVLEEQVMQSTEVRRVLLDRDELERIVARLAPHADAYLIHKLTWNLAQLPKGSK